MSRDRLLELLDQYYRKVVLSRCSTAIERDYLVLVATAVRERLEVINEAETAEVR